jgi:hypothetical protein
MTEQLRREGLAPPAPDLQDRASSTADLPILSLDEIADLYLGEKILLEITAHDDHHVPSHGRVLGHWPNIDENQPLIYGALSDALARPDKPEHGYYLFLAYHYIRTGEELRKRIKEVEEGGYDPSLDRGLGVS